MLMLPWIILTVIGAIPYCIKLIFQQIKDLIDGKEGGTVLAVLLGSLLGVGEFWRNNLDIIFLINLINFNFSLIIMARYIFI